MSLYIHPWRVEMDIQEVKIGTRFELELINSLGEKKSQTYISQLVETSTKSDLLVLCPIFESKYVFIATGSNIRITGTIIMPQFDLQPIKFVGAGVIGGTPDQQIEGCRF